MFNNKKFYIMKAKYVTPFSNGEQARAWYGENCEICTTKRNCFARTNIENGFVISKITLRSARFIGTETETENFVELCDTCKEKDRRKVKNYLRKDSGNKLF